MIKFLVLFLLISFLAVLPISFIPLVVLAIITALHSEQAESAFVVILSGLLLDFFSGLPDGVLTLSLVIAALTGYFLSHAVLAAYNHRLILFVSILSASLVFNLSVILFTLFLSIFNLVNAGEVARQVFSGLLIHLSLTAVLSYPIMWLYESVQRIKLSK